MTLSTTQTTGREPARHIRSYAVSRVIKTQAERLQRKGPTLSEIAETLSYERQAIVQILYWRKVQP